MRYNIEKGIVFLIILILLIGLLSNCSNLRNPTKPEEGEEEFPPYLTPENHEAGYGKSNCQFCHIINRLEGHQGIELDECFGCHGSNGTGVGDLMCKTCHLYPPESGAHKSHPTFYDSSSQQIHTYNKEARINLNRLTSNTIKTTNAIYRKIKIDTDSGNGKSAEELVKRCYLCHYKRGVGSPYHRNGKVDVNLNPKYEGFFYEGKCSVEVCHGSGRPDWYNDKNLDCTDCHKIGGGAFNDPTSGLHGANLPTMNSDCHNCHQSPPSTHYNQKLDNPDNIKPDGGAYEDQTPEGYNPDGSSGVCYGMNSPCHSPELRLEWSPYVACGSCHGATADNPPKSGAHFKHASKDSLNYPCSTCHYGYDSGEGPEHMNGTVNVRIDPQYGGTFDGSTCSNVRCHGSGTPNWFKDKNLYCSDCHNFSPNYFNSAISGQHQTHFEEAKLICQACHKEPPSTHYNNKMDNPDNIIPDKGNYNDTTPNGYNPSGSSGTCSNMQSPCHQTGDWNTSKEEACGSCHGVTPENPPTSGSHFKHASASERAYPCSTCHYGYSSGMGEEHYNGVVDVRFDPNSYAGPSAYYSDNTCYGVYCHGDGQPPTTGGFDTTPQWGDPSTEGCGSCHGASQQNPPASGKHHEHVGEMGFDCSLCHYGAGASDPSKMPDMKVEVNFDKSQLPDAYYQNGTCFNVCHSPRKWKD